MKKYIIEESALQAIINYLSSRPYKEVHEGIKLLTQLNEYKIKEVKNNEKNNT